jgi:hypothetical protein
MSSEECLLVEHCIYQKLLSGQMQGHSALATHWMATLVVVYKVPCPHNTVN